MTAVAWILMAKAPLEGQVKTRLGQDLGNLEAAASLQAAFLADLLGRRWQRGPRVLVWAGDLSHPLVDTARAVGWSVMAQGGGDLGMRMHAAFVDVRRSHQVGALMTGADSVDLPVSAIAWASNQVRAQRVAFLPALDGGYVALGWPATLPLVLDGVRWSTAETLADHISRLRACTTEYAIGPRWSDVDNVADLARLAVHCARSSGRTSRACTRHTRAWFVRHHALLADAMQRSFPAPISPSESYASR